MMKTFEFDWMGLLRLVRCSKAFLDTKIRWLESNTKAIKVLKKIWTGFEIAKVSFLGSEGDRSFTPEPFCKFDLFQDMSSTGCPGFQERKFGTALTKNLLNDTHL
jgi:hypothetical protein